MTSVNATTLRKNLFNMLSDAIKYNETINVNTKEGNVVILSEDEYNNILATLELSSYSQLYHKIMAGKNENIADCIDIDEVNW